MSATAAPATPIAGYMAEFDDMHKLIDAIGRVRREGVKKLEAYTPFPSHEVIHALGHKNYLSALVFLGGMTGTCTGLALQYWVSAIEYPMNIAGRPLFSWPSFIIVCFELTILFAALTAVFGMLALNGLPQPYHPVFNVKRFELASRNRFFLMIESDDPLFDMHRTKDLLRSTKPLAVEEVPH